MSTSDTLPIAESRKLAPIDINDATAVSTRYGYSALWLSGDLQPDFVRWDSVHYRNESVRLYSHRNAIEGVVQLSPKFTHGTDYDLAIGEIRGAERHLVSLGYGELSLAVGSLQRQISEKRLRECKEQASWLSGLIAEDPDLYVLLAPRPTSSELTHRIAGLRGMIASTTEEKPEPFPSLIVAGETGDKGLIPETYGPFGLYVKRSN